MTQQWQLSGNAESVDWSDLAMAGRAYADNLVGEPAVSKVMHMMADEIERLRTVIRPEPYARSDEKRVLCDTKSPRNGALSGCEAVPDPDSRVWETPRTPPPHATHPQGSVQDKGSFRDSRNAKEPVTWLVLDEDGAVGFFSEEDAARICAMQLDGTYVPLYRDPPPPALTDDERESLELLADYADSRGEDRVASDARGLLARLGGEQ